MSADRTAVELNQQREQFLLSPHKAKKFRATARTLWESEQDLSEKNRTDGWTLLYKHTVKKPDGTDRTFGVEVICALRVHLACLQQNKCCYCRRWLQNVAQARPVEHILSRDDYPQFSLNYWNLALCCRDCNQLKTNKNWSALPSTATAYPSTVADHYHPRLHIYDRHIRFVRLETNDSSIAVYQGLTKQGRQLCRDHLKTISQVDSLFRNNPRISQAIERLQARGDVIDRDAHSSLGEFINALHTAVHRIADRT